MISFSWDLSQSFPNLALGGYMTRLFPREPSTWAFSPGLVRCPEKTLQSPSYRIYVWLLCSGSWVGEVGWSPNIQSAHQYSLNPSVFSTVISHTSTIPASPVQKPPVYCLWEINLCCQLLLRKSQVTAWHGESGSGGKGNLPASTPFLPTLLLQPHLYSHFQRSQEHQFLPLLSVPKSLRGSPHKRLCRWLCPPCLLAQSPVLHRFCCFCLFHPHWSCVSGFQEERELSICVQFASFNSKAVLVLSPACSGDSFKPQMSDPIPELSRSCGWVWGEERTFIMLCVIYKHAHVHTRVHIQPNSSLYII